MVDDRIYQQYRSCLRPALGFSEESWEAHLVKILILDQFSRNLRRAPPENRLIKEMLDDPIWDEEAYQSSLRFREKITPETNLPTEWLVFGLLPQRHRRTRKSVEALIDWCQEPVTRIQDPVLWEKFQRANQREWNLITKS